jgi:hypothetical protein
MEQNNETGIAGIAVGLTTASPFRAIREPVAGYDDPHAIQLIRCAEPGKRFGKRRKLVDGRYVDVAEYGLGRMYEVGAPIICANVFELVRELQAASLDPKVGVVHGAPRFHDPDVVARLRLTGNLFRSHAANHYLPCFHEVPRKFFMLDFDVRTGSPAHLRMQAADVDIIAAPEAAAAYVRDPRPAYRGSDVVEMLERVCGQSGYPRVIRVDQGSEFVSRDLDLWAYQNNVVLDFSRPGKPTDNAFIEAFNGRLRAECLNTHWFLSLADAREKLECWRRDYNEVRPHGAIGNKPPAALLECIGATSPSMPKEAGKSTLR